MRRPKYKIGDRVKILRRPTEEEMHIWRNTWTYDMNKRIGKICTITEVCNSSTWGYVQYRFDFSIIGCHFPEIVLAPIGQLEFDFMFLKHME